jgi:signal-transduction protein with cAMP-binding, CBS, and nucleotidyltransferase domain
MHNRQGTSVTNGDIKTASRLCKLAGGRIMPPDSTSYHFPTIDGDDMQVHDRISEVLNQKAEGIWSIAPGATVYDALALMADKHIGALLVMKGNRLAGLISERDYARKVILKGRSSKDTRVDEIMASDPITVDPSCTVDKAMRIMTENRVRHLPVLGRDGSVLGLVSIGDLVNWIISAHQETIEHLQSYIAGNF